MAGWYDDVAEFYDGYTIGGRQIMCHWIVLQLTSGALKEGNNPRTFMPENYWISTSSNGIVEKFLRDAAFYDVEMLHTLLTVGTVKFCCNEGFPPEITVPVSLSDQIHLLLHMGYLTYERDSRPDREDRNALIRIPNREVMDCFRSKAAFLISRNNPDWREMACSSLKAILAGDAAESRKLLREMLMDYMCFCGTSFSGSFHRDFLTGVLRLAAEITGAVFQITEYGNSFTVIILRNRKDGTAAILELKKSNDGKRSSRLRSCQEAVDQINERQYDYHLRQDGDYNTIFKYGLSFWGKKCEILLDESGGQGS